MRGRASLGRKCRLRSASPFFVGWGRPDHSEMPLAHMLPILPPLRSRGWSWISYGIDLVGREIRAYCNGFEVWKIGTVRSSKAGRGARDAGATTSR